MDGLGLLYYLFLFFCRQFEWGNFISWFALYEYYISWTFPKRIYNVKTGCNILLLVHGLDMALSGTLKLVCRFVLNSILTSLKINLISLNDRRGHLTPLIKTFPSYGIKIANIFSFNGVPSCIHHIVNFWSIWLLSNNSYRVSRSWDTFSR